MTRFCAVFAPHTTASATSADNVDNDVARIGGRVVYYAGPRCALGTLPDPQPRSAAGPYLLTLPPGRDGSPGVELAAVGQVTLYNRAALHTALVHADQPAPPGCSDGELLLRYYAHAGIEGFAQVSGIFACAIWNGSTLLLTRDAIGGRKLFYAREAGGRWLAASSMRALRRWPPLVARLNLAAVRSYLTFAYLPGDETLLDGVFELLPGHCLTIGADGAPHLVACWQLCEQQWNPDTPPDHYRAHLRGLLEEAVAACLPPGEEVAVFLSGGIDSSLVTALAARLHNAPITTYAIHFGKQHANELAYAAWVADHCGTRHRVVEFSGKQVVAHLPETMALLDSPVGEPLTVPNLLLARAAAAEGMGVILNGEGGDPLFGGPKNLPLLLFELHRSDSNPSARVGAYLRSYRACYDDLPNLLTPAAREALRTAPEPERFVLPYLVSPEIRSYLNRLMMINIRTKGAHHILAKVEALTSAAGLEGRSPIFERAIVEYSLAIPPHLKLAGTTEKWILKQAVSDLLPSMVVYRPKSGMQTPIGAWLRGPPGCTPLGYWLRGPLGKLAADVLLAPRAQARGIFRPETIRAWLRGEHILWPRHANKIWLLLTLELWLRAFLDDESS